MILKGIQRSIYLLSFARHSSGVLLLDDKTFQTDYDILISDIGKDDLSGIISKRLGKKNLTTLSSDEQEFQKIRNGIIFGRNSRSIISLPTRFKDKQSIWIHYLIDTGSPWTFLSIQSAAYLIDSKEIQVDQMFDLKINGLDLGKVGISRPHFQDVNLLGMDYLINHTYTLKGKEKVASIQFDDGS